jgi:oxygen-independent coproporphyrinogen-3 oxidase
VRGEIIEGLLCRNEADIPAAILAEVYPSLEPFTTRGLASITESRLGIAENGLPYARTIAALFDPYRSKSQRRFSSAV